MISYEDVRLDLQHDKIYSDIGIREIIPRFAVGATHASLHSYLDVLKAILAANTALELQRTEIDRAEKASFYTPFHDIVVTEVLIALVCVCSPVLQLLAVN